VPAMVTTEAMPTPAATAAEEQPVFLAPPADLPGAALPAEAAPVPVAVEAEVSVAPVEETAVPEPPVDAVEVPVVPIEDLPKDAPERLALARSAMVTGTWSQALTVYQSLVVSSDLLNAVIGDLEEGIRKHPDDYAGYQLVGDAYMKDGRLPEALRAYRAALTRLHK
jgi:hypothetical protein